MACLFPAGLLRTAITGGGAHGGLGPGTGGGLDDQESGAAALSAAENDGDGSKML